TQHGGDIHAHAVTVRHPPVAGPVGVCAWPEAELGWRAPWLEADGRETDQPAREDSMRSAWVRQTHRWLAIVFTLTVVANFVALAVRGGQQPPAFITYSPLPPLFLLM